LPSNIAVSNATAISLARVTDQAAGADASLEQLDAGAGQCAEIARAQLHCVEHRGGLVDRPVLGAPLGRDRRNDRP
jgi:hypothetical protein